MVRSRLEVVSLHMHAFVAAEERRCEDGERRLQAMNERLQSLEQETHELRSRVSEHRSRALLDALTGIPNRLAFEQRMAQELVRWKRYPSPMALLVWDVDGFKQINDTYGHKAGDKALKTIAHLLARHIRETDFMARYGGDEFVMLFLGADLAAAKVLAEDLRVAVQNCGFHDHGTRVPVTISCGITVFGPHDIPERVFDRADRALYMAKQQGRNCCFVLASEPDPAASP